MTERTPAVLETLALLDRAGVLTPTSLALEADLSLEEFTALGVALDRLHDSSNWWIADWLLIGEQRFGENLAQAAAALQRSERTLQNYAWVASHVAPSRRREALSFTHHVLVAPFDPAEQTRWLEQAEREGWSSRELGERIEAGRTLTPVLDVQTIVDRTAQRLSRRLPEEAGVRDHRPPRRAELPRDDHPGRAADPDGARRGRDRHLPQARLQVRRAHRRRHHLPHLRVSGVRASDLLGPELLAAIEELVDERVAAALAEREVENAVPPS